MKTTAKYILLIGIMAFLYSCSKDIPPTPPHITNNDSTISDIEGNIYNVVKIGDQIWMKENLKVTKYRNGNPIPTTSPATKDISGEASPKYQWAYNGVDSNVLTYGRLYTWYAITDNRSVCPNGWHIPSDVEWTTLDTYLGEKAQSGRKLKERGTIHWYYPNTEATNITNFTALPAGFRVENGHFDYLKRMSYFISSTENYPDAVWYRVLAYNSGGLGRGNLEKNIGYSVRCVKD